MSMNNSFVKRKTDKQAIDVFEALTAADVTLPHNQRVLRAYLFNLHPGSGYVVRSMTSQRPSSRIVVTPFLVIGLCVAGVLLFRPPPPRGAQWLAISAAHRVRNMSPSRVAQIRDDYRYSLRTCLDEAIRSKTLRTISLSRFRVWGGSAHVTLPVSATLLSYVNSRHERIVIGLNKHQEPLYVVDLDER